MPSRFAGKGHVSGVVVARTVGSVVLWCPWCFVRAHIFRGCVSLLRCWQQWFCGPYCQSLAWDSGYPHRRQNKHTGNLKYDILRRVTLPEQSCERKLSHPIKIGDTETISLHCVREDVFGSIGTTSLRGARWCLRWRPACRWFDLQCLHDEPHNVVANPHCQAAMMWADVGDGGRELPNVRKSIRPIWSWVYVWWESVPQVRCLPTSTYTIDNFMRQRATKITRQEKRHTRNTHEKHGADSKQTETHGKFEQNTNWHKNKNIFIAKC